MTNLEKITVALSYSLFFHFLPAHMIYNPEERKRGRRKKQAVHYYLFKKIFMPALEEKISIFPENKTPPGKRWNEERKKGKMMNYVLWFTDKKRERKETNYYSCIFFPDTRSSGKWKSVGKYCGIPSGKKNELCSSNFPEKCGFQKIPEGPLAFCSFFVSRGHLFNLTFFVSLLKVLYHLAFPCLWFKK